jgi:NIPSNAP
MTAAGPPPTNSVQVLGDFPVLEFRRYAIKPGEREHFAAHFESYFPEAFQQLGSVAAGTFLDRGNPTGFTWIRAYHTIEARAVINAAFYYGPVWREHRTTLNDLMDDSDNVLLLQAVSPDRAVTILPAVDPVREAGARGVAVALICQLDPGTAAAFARAAEPVFAKYRSAGARETGLFATLDVPNNFPQLPVRNDGPYLVWLGLLPNDAALGRFREVADPAMATLTGTGMVRGTPELLVLDPTPRSRLRWLRQQK